MTTSQALLSANNTYACIAYPAGANNWTNELGEDTYAGGFPVDVDRLFTITAGRNLAGVFALDDNRMPTTDMIGSCLINPSTGIVSGAAVVQGQEGEIVSLSIGSYSGIECFFNGLIEWHLHRNHALKFKPDTHLKASSEQ